MPIPKKVIVARKRKERASAGLVEFKCWIKPADLQQWQDGYDDYCFHKKVPDHLRTKFKRK